MVGKSKVFTSLETLFKYNGQAAPNVPIDPRNDVAFLPYSSGTTGKDFFDLEKLRVRVT